MEILVFAAAVVVSTVVAVISGRHAIRHRPTSPAASVLRMIDDSVLWGGVALGTGAGLLHSAVTYAVPWLGWSWLDGWMGSAVDSAGTSVLALAVVLLMLLGTLALPVLVVTVLPVVYLRWAMTGAYWRSRPLGPRSRPVRSGILAALPLFVVGAPLTIVVVGAVMVATVGPTVRRIGVPSLVPLGHPESSGGPQAMRVSWRHGETGSVPQVWDALTPVAQFLAARTAAVYLVATAAFIALDFGIAMLAI